MESIHALSESVLGHLRQYDAVTVFVSADACLCFLRRLDRDFNSRGKTMRRILSELSSIDWRHLENAEHKTAAQYVLNSGATNAELTKLIRGFRTHQIDRALGSKSTRVWAFLNECAENLLSAGAR